MLDDELLFKLEDTSSDSDAEADDDWSDIWKNWKSQPKIRSWDEACEQSSRETLQGWKNEDDAKKIALEDAQKKGTMVLMC